MAAKAVRVGGVAAGSIAGAGAFQAFLQGYPPAVIADTRALLEKGADHMVENIKARAPVSELEATAGELRDSVHKESGRHDLSVVVIEDGKDDQGRPIAAHVEQGHKARDGSHVAAIPHFWPAVRDGKREIIREIRAGMKRAAKAAPP